MNHRPFEDWLAHDQSLTIEQKRQLQTHTKDCAHCSALADVTLELHSAKMAAPAPKFTARFQQRLAAQRVVERRNRLAGLLILTLGGLGLIGWYASPIAISFLASPAGWLAAIINFLLSLAEMGRALGEIGFIFFRTLPGFIPPFGWMVIISTLSGFALLWSVSLWRFTRFVKGAQP